MIPFLIKVAGILIAIMMMSIIIRISTLHSTAAQMTIILKTTARTFQSSAAQVKIYAGGSSDFIIYKFGDGNDTVSGKGIIQILGANYSTLKSGNDLILAVGDYYGLKSATQMLNGTIKLIGGEKYFKVEGTCNGQRIRR